MRFIIEENTDNNAVGYNTTYDGQTTINLFQIKSEVDAYAFCNTENLIIHRTIDVILHEIYHNLFSEIGECDLLNEQDENIFVIIRDWNERGKLT